MTALTVAGSMLQSSPQPSSSRGRMLVTAFRSPATAAAFAASIPGSKLLTCHFASLPITSTARSIFGSATGPRFAPRPGRLNASNPLQLPRPTRLAASPASTPLRDRYVPPDQSVLPDLLQADPPSDSARFPFAPRCQFLSLVVTADQRSRFGRFVSIIIRNYDSNLPKQSVPTTRCGPCLNYGYAYSFSNNHYYLDLYLDV
jgi:hypothetical protein